MMKRTLLIVILLSLLYRRVLTGCPTTGYYSNSCYPCPGGTACSSTSLGTQCTAGHYRPAYTWGSCLNCPGGTYSYAGWDSCPTCPGGQACSATSLGAYCTPGYYKPAATYGSCSTCPTGTYSGTGWDSCPSCPGGYVCSATGVGSQCTAGYYRPAGTYGGCLTCGAGTYSGAGWSSCSSCPGGYECYATYLGPICPAGTYRPANTYGGCLNCAAGTYSLGGQASCTPCPGGWYCSATNKWNQCPYGTYLLANTWSETCIDCPGGKPCTASAHNPSLLCPGGTYLDALQYSPNAATCNNCPNANYCPQGSFAPIPCPDVPGTYAGIAFPACKPCEPGYACPTLSGADRYYCSFGMYSVTGEIECHDCPGARGCKAELLGATCPGGRYNPYKNWAEFCLIAPEGTYTLPGAFTTIDCTLSYYSAAEADHCTLCETNYRCPTVKASNRSPCPAGTFSVEGSTFCSECPAGRYCDPINNVWASQGDCPTGYYSITNQFHCVADPIGYERNVKRTAVTVCDASTPYTNAFESVAACTTCPPGYYCNGPVVKMCALGTYSPGGLSACLACPGGAVCPDRVNVVPCPGKGPSSTDIACDMTPDPICEGGKYLNGGVCDLCPPGKYCPGSPSTATDCLDGSYSLGSTDICTICPAGSSCLVKNAAPVPCGTGFYSLIGFKDCVKCPAGYQCSNSAVKPVQCLAGTYALEGATACVDCPAGFYCDDETVAPKDCPDGYYSAAKKTTCTPCPGGAYCNRYTGVGTECAAGYFAAPGIYVTACTKCTEGNHCPSKLGGELPCPIGSYSAEAATACTLCEAGYKCPSTLASAKQQCQPPTYSYEGATDCTTCPDGFTCATAGAMPTKCAAGTYSSADHLSCVDCEITYACPNGYSAAKYLCPIERTATTKQSICTVIPDKSYCTTRNPANIVTCLATEYLVGDSCVAATAGHYYYDAYTVPPECPAGWYAAAGDSKCKICDAGKNCPNKDGTGITDCPAGTWSEPGTSTGCTDCPIGRACPSLNKPLKLECEAGYYAPNIKMTACIKCPANKQCLDKKTAVDCPLHYYSLEGWGICRPCPSGMTCSTNPPTDCGTGKYSIEGDNDCHDCPAGMYCPLTRNSAPNLCQPGTATNSLGSVTCPDCSAGTYALAGAKVCVPCPAGSYCPDVARPPIICPLGTYSTGSKTACTDCDTGYVCLPGSISATPASDKCPKGYYCYHSTVNAASRLIIEPCPKGKYGIIDGGGDEATACGLCPLGFYCPLTATINPITCPWGTTCEITGLEAPNPCPGGTYNEIVGRTSTSDCKQCPGGNYCPVGTYEPRACPAGYYCAPGSTTYSSKCPLGTYTSLKPSGASNDCTPCPEGTYCVEGAFSPTFCPPGKYNSDTGKSSADDCKDCIAGTACPKYGNRKPDNDIPCPAGYYCPAGTKFPTQYPCPAGTYSNEMKLTADTQCTQCPAGYACSSGTNRFNNQMVICAPGHYCPAGTKTPTENKCPAGYYQPYHGMVELNDCYKFKCPPGYYCPEASFQIAGECDEGYYCEEMSTTSKNAACPDGTYAPGKGLKKVTECITCQPGTYCPAGTNIATIVKCPAGTYNPSPGKSLSSDCLPCEEGYYCPVEAGDKMLECGLAKYSGPGAKECLICPSANYCNSYTTKESDITAGKQLCVAGFLCPKGTGEFPHESLRCEKGKYCEAGQVYPKTCPPGTYNPNRGAASEADCLKVPAGYYASRASDVPEGGCAPGYYCPEGSVRAQMVPCPAKTFRSRPNGESLADCGPCPAGYYCLIATVDPIPCPPGHYCLPSTDTPLKCPKGTFGASPRLRELSQCTECWSGRYCSQDGLTYPDGKCDPGYYCVKGAIIPNPTDGTTGGLCPAGAVCPQGSPTGLPCKPGTFSATTGLRAYSECATCTSGKFCIGEVKNGVSGPCKEGYYCPPGSQAETQSAAEPGYFSLGNVGGPTQCPPGKYNPDYAQSKCLTCPSGYYCSGPGNAGTFTICPVGSYCVDGSGGPSDCPYATYNPVTGLRKVEECLPCKAGWECRYSGYSDAYRECSNGYYCAEGTRYRNQVECGYGYYCPQGTPRRIPCPVGTYNDYYTTGYDLVHCASCLAGYYCGTTGISTLTTLCDPGYYCPTGTKVPRPSATYCNIGQKCPRGSASPQNCPAGTYQDSVKQADCMPCPRGFYCPTGSSRFDDKPCPAGYYCPQGSSDVTKQQCPSGTYNKWQGAFAIEQCLPCPPGKCCTGTGLATDVGLPNCDAGYFCIAGSNDCRQNACPAGSYCPAGSSYGIPCDGGYYCSSYNSNSRQNSCTAGNYCPPGSSGQTTCPAGRYCLANSAYPTPCPAGKYQPSTGQSSCLNCPAGHYCPNLGMSAQGPTCEAGYVCDSTANAITPRPNNKLCPAGYKCIAGTGTADICIGSTFQEKVGQSTCDECPAGYYCTESKKFLCQPALSKESYHCPAGSRDKVPCSAGYYNLRAGTTDSSDCLPCPRGFYCPNSASLDKLLLCAAGSYCNRAINANQNTCPAGSYCPAGTALAILCPPGKYCTSGQAAPNADCNAGSYCPQGSNSATYQPCPSGHYCPAGTPEPIACPPGKYFAGTGASAETNCVKCTAGMYCTNRARTSDSSTNCPAKYYCPSGTAGPNTKPCEPGYYCDGSDANQIPCPPGKYQPLPAQSSCITCEERFYCPSDTLENRQRRLICPAGKYCPLNTGATPPLCPTGTYSPREGLRDSTECENCPPGKVCDSAGLSAATKLCRAGYFCALGAKTDAPASLPQGGVCPSGHYCPAGTAVPIPCPPGTFTEDGTGFKTNADCQPCPLTYYCPFRGGYRSLYHIGQTPNTNKCAAGYICISGSDTPTPTDNVMGKKCAAGKYCGVGASTETDCAKGTYNPYEGQSSCLPCPAGRLCDTTGMSAYITCPLGKFCTGSTQTPTPCPIGTYSPNVNIASADDCYQCDPGMYCSGGSSTPTGTCADGYVCARGSTVPTSLAIYSFGTSKEGRCPTGHYCLAGAKAPSQCPPGTYQDEVGQTTCKNCPAKYYCPKSGISDPTLYPCFAGYICLGSSITPTPLELSEGGRPCNEGYYCPFDTGLGYTQELPCPAGTYEPRKGSILCQPCPPGFYCTGGGYSPTVCPQTYYCEANTVTPVRCPDGTYSLVTGLQSKEQCRLCPSGEYCTDGQRKGSCAAGFYCPAGAKIPNDPSMTCPPGAYCLTGSTRPTVCPIGKVRLLPGGVSEADCSSCTVGYYCIPGAATPIACPKGHYCRLQAPEPTPCPRGTYQPYDLVTSESGCIACPQGHYCSEEGLSDLSQVKCPPGNFCPSATEPPTPCPKGYYFDGMGAYSAKQCKTCPEGFYCEEGTITPRICQEGSYCPEGSYKSTDCPERYFCRYALYYGRTVPLRQPCLGGYYCPLNTIDPIKCENGYYCPPMSKEPIPCPSGTTGTNAPVNDDITTGCTVCQPGTYSSAGIGATKCLPCQAGYVCLLGATKPNPTDKDVDKGYECPKGYYCPEGSYEPIACPPGRFNNKVKGTTDKSCMPCERGTYNNMDGQIGCKSCGPSSTSNLGEETCTCVGKNRVFHMTTGKCLCRQFYTSVQYGDTEDSKKDCRPLLMDRCATGYLRDTMGNCVKPDDCSKECKGKPGRRAPGIGICQCNEIADPDAFCDSNCRAKSPVIMVTQNGQLMTKSSEYNGTDSIKSSTKIMGEPKCPAGGCKVFSLNMESEGGFSADYQPSQKLKAAIAGSSRILLENPEKARRFLESTPITNNTNTTNTVTQKATTKVTNPAICITVGDSVTFDIPDANHYPVYLKDAMANSNPSFDYSNFIMLENKIKSGEVPGMFIYTFNQAGVYVFADNADKSQMTIFSVMGKTERCPNPDKAIVPITGESLTKMGVRQNEDVTLVPDWIFIGCCFIVILILVPGVVVLISWLYNSGKNEQKKLAAISFANKQAQAPLTSERTSLLANKTQLDNTDNALKGERTVLDIKGEKEDNEVDPGIFEEIYAQLRAHAQYVKEEFEKKADVDRENIQKVWNSMKELKKVIKTKLKNIAKIFGKNIKYLLSEKKSNNALKKLEAEKIQMIEEEKAQEALEDAEEEEDHDMNHITEVINLKNAEDLKELARIQEQEDAKVSEFMHKYVEEQSHRLETFKEKVLENANISEPDRNELLRQYEEQLSDLQKALLISQREQDYQLKIRLDARKNQRGQLAALLDKLNIQRKELIKLIDGQLLDIEMKVKADEKTINERAMNERNSIEREIDQRKADSLRKLRANMDSKIKRTSDPRKRTEILEQYEKDVKEVNNIFAKEKQNMIDQFINELNARVKEQLATLHNTANVEIESLKQQKKTQLDQIKDQELIIMNKLGNVVIDEKITEAIEADRMKNKEEEQKFESAKEEYLRKLEDISTAEREKVNKIREEYMKDEDMLKEDYDVQKRIITNAIKKKSEDIQKQKEKYAKELKNGLLNEDDEIRVKERIRTLDEQLSKRIEEEVSKQDIQFQQKLKEKRKLRANREAEIKETHAHAKSALEKEWLEKEATLKTQMRKDRLNRLLEELKSRTKDEELPIAAENVIENIHIEELTDLLGKQYREKAYLLSDNIGELIQSKLIEVNKVKEIMEQQFQKLKESYEKGQILHSDYERRLRDIQSRENDQLRDIELAYIQKQNDMERLLLGNLAEKHEQELIKLREEQWNAKRNLISEIALRATSTNGGIQNYIQTILGGGDLEKNIREIEEYKEQLRSLREKKLAELEERRMRLQSIAIENEDAIKRFNEGTKKMLDEQAKREREREDKRKAEIEKMKVEHEVKMKKQEGITEEERQKILEDYNADIERLNEAMAAEQKRQEARMMEKLEKRIKEHDQMKAQKQIQLMTYRKEVASKMDKEIKDSQIKIDSKIEVKDVKVKVLGLIEKYDNVKKVFDKKKRLEGVDNIDELAKLENIDQLRDKEPEDEVGGLLANIDFDNLYEKIGTMEERVGIFTEEQFYKIVEGFRVINSTLNELKEKATAAKMKKYQ